MKKLFTLLAIISVFATQITPVFAATVARSSQATQTEESEIVEPEVEVEDAIIEEESEVVEPEVEDAIIEEESEVVEPEVGDAIIEEESEVVEPEVEVEDAIVEGIPVPYDVGDVGRKPYKKTPVETTDTVVRMYGVEQLNEFERGQVSSYVDPNVIADKHAAIDQLEALTPQSPQPYEVAVVNEADEYFFIEGQPTFEEAVALTQSVELAEGEEAVVINANGMVTYSNSNVARVFKTINGSLYRGCDINTTLYREASLSTETGYINQCYTDDVPVLAIQGDAAKIMVAGKIAWVRISSDLIYVSTNQVVNPSYYANENGHFVHYISTNLTTSGGTKLELGPRNPKLKDNVKYYSYDGKYFYTNPETIGPDMNDGVVNSAVNANDPYYNYFLNLPFTSKSVATATQINNYINANTQATSKLRNTGQAFIDAQEKYGVNAMMMLGIAINESGWGMSSIAQEKNNLFGLNAVDATPGQSANYFPSVAQCINDYASEWIAQGYADPEDWRYYGGMLGNKNLGANVKYASDAYWSEKAAAHIYSVDRGINGGSSKEWDYYSLGLFTGTNSVKSPNGKEVYPVTQPYSNGSLAPYSAYVDTAIILRETDASDGKYVVWPERNNTIQEGVQAQLPYNWTNKEYVSSSGVKVINSAKETPKMVTYQTHVQSYGWQGWKSDGQTAGTSGESKRLEAIQIVGEGLPIGASIVYQTHVQSYGWQGWKRDGELAGTSGESKRLEAIRIKLENAPGYSVEYRVHIQDVGWQEWRREGQISGTEGQSKRLEAIQIRIVKTNTTPNVAYQTHVQSYGWQDWKHNAALAGTEGQSKRLEGIRIMVDGLPAGANVTYRTHVQSYGWQSWKRNGETSGTVGASKRLEGIEIKLENAPGYSIEYRVHVQSYGWQPWVRDGQLAGTVGQSKRLEGIQIRIVKN